MNQVLAHGSMYSKDFLIVVPKCIHALLTNVSHGRSQSDTITQ